MAGHGKYPKASGYLERKSESVAHPRIKQAGQVDAELPAHPLPQAQQCRPLAVLSDEPIEGTQYVTHATYRLVNRLEQIAEEQTGRDASEHVQTKPANW
jgi:hypothetical protein